MRAVRAHGMLTLMGLLGVTGVADVSASIDTDDYFELMIRNAWHITGGEGVVENTSNRYVRLGHFGARRNPADVPYILGQRPAGVSVCVCRRRVLVVHSDGSEEVVEIKRDLGVRADDLAEMRRRLIAQGVKDIARIELTG